MGVKLAREVTGVNPRFGRRSWVKLWVNEWLDGTTRSEMTDAQRAFWIDLLAMAGRSRFPGRVCAGQTNGVFVGYSLNKFQALMAEPIDVEQTLTLFERTGKIKITVTAEAPVKLVMLELLNWDKYQSEYQRQKKYRGKLQQGDAQSYNHGNNTETEVEVEEEVEVEAEVTAAAAFKSMKCEPYGSKPFRRVFGEELNKPNGTFVDAMERTIQRCQKLKVKVPGRFFAHKRELEKNEAEQAYKRTPL